MYTRTSTRWMGGMTSIARLRRLLRRLPCMVEVEEISIPIVTLGGSSFFGTVRMSTLVKNGFLSGTHNKKKVTGHYRD